MKTQCLPFSQVPHSTRLFLDYLSNSPSVRPFYPRTAHFHEWFREEAPLIRYDQDRRQRVAGILERQNRNWGASTKTLENVSRLRDGAYAIVTGQQVGLFGGPLFAILKALNAVKLAALSSEAGIPAVPVFWMATEDHDLAEINHASFLDLNHDLERLTATSQGTPGAPVGNVRLGEEIIPVVERAATLLGETEIAGFLRDAYKPNETVGSAFARFYTQVFAGQGIILLDPLDAEFHATAEPIYRAAIEHAGSLNQALLERGKALTKAGYHEQVKVTAASTALFAIQNGARLSIHRHRNSEEFFEIGTEKVGRDELLQRISAHPEDFSANVLLRPVVQDYLLPTLTYIGGAAEVAYFAQVGVTYEKLLGRITPVLSRFSSTLVDAKSAKLLERYKLSFPDLFAGEEAVLTQIAERSLPADVQQRFEDAEQALEASLQSVNESLGRLDETLVEAAERAGSKMRYQWKRLRTRAAHAELRRSEILSRHARQLSNTLYPFKSLQEREISAAQLLSRHSLALLDEISNAIHPSCVDHQLVFLNQ